MRRRVEIEIGTNSTSKSPQTYSKSTKEASVSKRITETSTTNEDIIQIKLKDNLNLTGTMRSSGVAWHYVDL